MPEAFLEHTNGEQMGQLVKLDKREMLIGRLPDCNIITEATFTSVSQHHAIIRKTSEGWIIIDVGTRGNGSTYGTYINENRLAPNREFILSQGDEIRFGTKMGKYFRFHGEGTMPVSQPISLKGRLRISEGRRLLLLDGRPLSVSLTRQEFDFLLILWQESGAICQFKDICCVLWPEAKVISDDIDADIKVRINTLVHGLRRKLNTSLDGVDILESCRGVGYRLRF
ncbi:MAG: FHA domain-containing protein [Dehalococcoides mccartyi]|uniref:FHA domain-containing protein n=1 Tax=Dehalococcoides TaxID=61434 RepID=UPI00273789C2|nr:FHA domain-containing protein [Dehalococcoides mccartyi]MDP4280434.1 FHA domain-containing protein [Dehalococcoides mccartyi]